MTVKFTNNASSSLASGINSTATSLTVSDASTFPSLSGADDYCYLTIQQATATGREVVKATARSGNSFTIQRGVDNTTAASFSSGDTVELRLTSALLQDVIDQATVEGIKTNFQYVPTSGQTQFSGADSSGDTMIINDSELVNVYMNGVRLVQGSDYTVSSANNRITLTSGATTADIIDIEVFGNFTGQSGAAVAITGGAIAGTAITTGSINNTPIGATQANTVAATTLTANGVTVGNTTIASNTSHFPNLTINNNGYIGSANNTTALQIATSGDFVLGTDGSTTTVAKGFSTGHASANRAKNVRYGMTDSTFTGMEIVNAAAANSSFNSQSINFITHEGAVSVATRMTIDSLGQVGIGGDPDKTFHIKTSAINTAFARIESTATNSYPTLSLKNDAREYQLTAHGGVNDSFVIYDGTAGQNRVVVDTSGNVMVGKATSDFTTAGVELAQGGTAGKVQLMRASGALTVANTTNDGAAISVYKGTTLQGVVGTVTTDLYVGTGDTGIRFNDAVNGVLPFNTTTEAQVDGQIDLGFSSVRWRDLYLSNAVYASQVQAENSNGSNGTTTAQYGVIAQASGGAQATIGAHHSGDGYANLNLGSEVSGVRNMWHISKRLSSLNNRLEFFYYDANGFNSKFQMGTSGSFLAVDQITSNKGVHATSVNNVDNGLIVKAGSGDNAASRGRFTNNAADIAIGRNIATFPGTWTKADNSVASGGWVIGSSGAAAFYQSNAGDTTPLADLRLLIDASGNVLAGTTDTTLFNNTTGGGIALMASNRLDVARVGDVVATFNRMSSDGSILQFYVRGVRCGDIHAIGTNGMAFAAPSNLGAALIVAGAANIVYPGQNSNGTVAVADNAIDLGASGVRFKDIYIGGSINHLDLGGNARVLYNKASNLLGNGGTNVLGYQVQANFTMFAGTSSPRSDIRFTSGTAVSTKRWGFGGGITGTNDVFYIINEANVGQYMAHGSQTWTAHSDERIKENIVDVGTVLPSLMNMRCVKYNLISNPDDTKIGFIAQDWESSFPEVVDENDHLVLEDDGTIGTNDESDSTTPVKAMAYTETIPLLLKAIQELSEKVDQQAARIAELEGG